MNQRASGILLHPTSLPNAYPSGDLGPTANRFVDFMVTSGQRRWQMLPIGPTGGENSPYQSPSAFAGNPQLLSPERLVEQGFLSRQEIEPPMSGVSRNVNFPEAIQWKLAVLHKAFEHSEKDGRANRRSEFDTFLKSESYWLNDFSLFSAIAERKSNSNWTHWEMELRTRQSDAILRAQKQFAHDVRYHEFVQWQFSVQWQELKAYCASKAIQLIGDVPLFVAHQSADVWAHPELFELNADGSPTVVAGVPPDYFSKTGQLWGLPVYRWEALQAEHYRWWIERLLTASRRFDINRLDHFIGFVRTYEMPSQATTALHGQYQPGGGASFFKAIRKALGALPLIADDLGETNQEVVALLDQFQIPGTRVLQFELDLILQADSAPTAIHPQKSVIYTGTHDNDTTAGWYEKLPGSQREALRKRLGADDQKIVWAMVREALASEADTAIVPAQDLLGLGSEARLNFPGIAKGNWGWRLEDGALNHELAIQLRRLTRECGRLRPAELSPVSWNQKDDSNSPIAKRAYELYEKRGRQSGQADEDWFKAEREIMLAAQQ
jgi:4-alpha-glucanotransferase